MFPTASVRCTWPSISPGSTVARVRSITRAPAGTVTLAAGPTCVIFSPWMRTTWLFNIWPDFGSNNLPARTAVVSGACACDQASVAQKTAPNNPNAIPSLDLRCITNLPKLGLCHLVAETSLYQTCKARAHGACMQTRPERLPYHAAQRPYTRILKFPGLAVANGCGCFSVGARGGLKSDVLRKTRCVFGSTWLVFAPYSVFTLSTSLSLSGESSW